MWNAANIVVTGQGKVKALEDVIPLPLRSNLYTWLLKLTAGKDSGQRLRRAAPVLFASAALLYHHPPYDV